MTMMTVGDRMTAGKGMKTYISVCKNIILSNLKHGTNKPPIRISRGLHGKPRHAKTLTLTGRCKVVYSPRKPAPWGARVWLEVDS